jgi:KDO2-lipid IV(A) lauroyltransferase
MGQRLVDAGYKINNIVKRQRNPYVFDKEMDAMTKSGMKITILQKTPKNIFKALKDKDIVEFLADQDAGDDGIFVDFFGVKASCATGPALFSLKMNCPLVFVIDIRKNDSPLKHEIYIESLEYIPNDDTEQDIYILTEILTKKLEKYIIAHPEQYFWLHKRWLTRPKR